MFYSVSLSSSCVNVGVAVAAAVVATVTILCVVLTVWCVLIHGSLLVSVFAFSF